MAKTKLARAFSPSAIPPHLADLFVEDRWTKATEELAWIAGAVLNAPERTAFGLTLRRYGIDPSARPALEAAVEKIDHVLEAQSRLDLAEHPVFKDARIALDRRKKRTPAVQAAAAPTPAPVAVTVEKTAAPHQAEEQAPPPAAAERPPASPAVPPQAGPAPKYPVREGSRRRDFIGVPSARQRIVTLPSSPPTAAEAPSAAPAGPSQPLSEEDKAQLYRAARATLSPQEFNLFLLGKLTPEECSPEKRARTPLPSFKTLEELAQIVEAVEGKIQKGLEAVGRSDLARYSLFGPVPDLYATLARLPLPPVFMPDQGSELEEGGPEPECAAVPQPPAEAPPVKGSEPKAVPPSVDVLMPERLALANPDDAFIQEAAFARYGSRPRTLALFLKARLDPSHPEWKESSGYGSTASAVWAMYQTVKEVREKVREMGRPDLADSHPAVKVRARRANFAAAVSGPGAEEPVVAATQTSQQVLATQPDSLTRH